MAWRACVNCAHILFSIPSYLSRFTFISSFYFCSFYSFVRFGKRKFFLTANDLAVVRSVVQNYKSNVSGAGKGCGVNVKKSIHSYIYNSKVDNEQQYLTIVKTIKVGFRCKFLDQKCFVSVVGPDLAFRKYVLQL